MLFRSNDQVVIVGGGMAGLTAAAYLSQAGIPVLLFEKEDKVGGLVNSFDYKGFSFDGGIRAIENSGIVLPMLRQLGIEIPFVRNGVSIGIEQDVVSLETKSSLADYLNLLRGKFPEKSQDIDQFGMEIEKIMQYMDVLYGIDNPLFLDMKKDRDYFVHTILPWMFKYIVTIQKIVRLDKPVEGYLQKITDSQALIDMIAQHFFQDTPTFFALSYFSLYLDYQYPQGGTGVLADRMRDFILEHQGEIRCETEITRLDPVRHQVEDAKGHVYPYRQLVWAADLKLLYQLADIAAMTNTPAKRAIISQKDAVSDKTGGDSILTLYLTLDMDKQYFASKTNAHVFYTPYKAGLSSLDKGGLMTKDSASDELRFSDDREQITEWLRQFFRLTTYEISCPVMRDESLAPEGKTGLIISTLFDYSLTKHIQEMGWYEEFKEIGAQEIIRVLDQTIYPGLNDNIIDQFVSTPLTLQRITGNSDGAITGWAFTNAAIPVVHSMTKIAKSVLTPIPDVYQAGQWTFSPSGLPISILTGKLAADKVIKKMKKNKNNPPRRE